MLKHVLILTIGLLAFKNLSAGPRDTLMYYLKNTGDVVADRAGADYTMLVMPADAANNNLFPVIQYYANGKRKLVAASATQSLDLVLEGTYVSYYPNGLRKCVMAYHEGKPLGDITEYYPNGKLYAVAVFGKRDNLTLVACRDSTGKVLAENGNGHWLKFDDNFTRLAEEGQIVNGKENGVWYKVIGNEKYPFTYAKGQIITDVDYTKTGPVLNMTDVMPAFAGGKDAFNAFLKRTIVYPKYAKDNNLTGSALVTFTVEKDGALTDLRITKSTFSGLLDAEALRVISLSPQWVSGSVHGVPARVRNTVTVNFTFADPPTN